MLPSSTDLKYFIEVAQTQNLSRAAERLGISQPSLSLAIQRLESSVGVALLIRSKSGVKLTRPGQRFLPEARDLLSRWESIRATAKRDETEVKGHYKIGCHSSVALYSLNKFLPEILATHPELEVSLFHDISRRVTEEVISLRVDFGLVINPVRHPDLVIKTIAQDEVTFWSAEKPTALQDLNSPECVLIYDPELAQSQELLKQVQKQDVVFNRVISCSNLEVIADLTAAGAGIGLLPTKVATRSESLGLKPVSKDLPRYYDSLSLIYRADINQQPAAKLIARFIEQSLKTK